MIGHRGASAAFPENTLLAFEAAIEAGAQALETDVRVSRDSVPVCFHDPTLDRTAGRPDSVAQLSVTELQDVDLGHGQTIPLLSEVLDRFPQVPLLLDIKEKAASTPVVEVLRRFGAEDRALIGSFDHSTLPPFRRLGIATVASRPETALFWVASRGGWPWLPVSYEAFSVPIRSSGVTVVDSRFLRLARRRSVPVHVWTIDDPAVARDLWAAGVSGIVTNRPDRMKGLLS